MERTWDDVRAEAVEDFGELVTDGCKFETFYLEWLENNCSPPERKEPGKLEPFTLFCYRPLTAAEKLSFPPFVEFNLGKNGIKYIFKPLTETKRRQIIHFIDKKAVKFIQIGNEELTNKVN